MGELRSRFRGEAGLNARTSFGGRFRLHQPVALAGAFDSDEMKVLTDAFDQAWKAVEQSGVCFASNAYKNATREVLALRIIEIAQLGERDPNRLRDDALLYLAKSTGL